MILCHETIADAPPYWVRQRRQARLTVDGLHAESAASFEQEHTLLVRAGVPGLSKTVAMVTATNVASDDACDVIRAG